MNYIINGINNLKYGVIFGVAVYIIIIFFLYTLKIRRIISRKCVVEVIFCIYSITLLMTTGIFTLNYSLNGFFSYNLIPFLGSSIIPVLLNFILFVPYGFLLPFVFSSCKGNWRKVVMHKIEAASDVYNCFTSQINNCGGHVLEPRSIAENEILNNNDCFIEIIYISPQTIVFENSIDFSISNADRILYNADRNILYWGDTYYQNCVDYTELTEELQEYRNEILEGYERLRMLITEYFN